MKATIEAEVCMPDYYPRKFFVLADGSVEAMDAVREFLKDWASEVMVTQYPGRTDKWEVDIKRGQWFKGRAAV